MASMGCSCRSGKIFPWDSVMGWAGNMGGYGGWVGWVLSIEKMHRVMGGIEISWLDDSRSSQGSRSGCEPTHRTGATPRKNFYLSRLLVGIPFIVGGFGDCRLGVLYRGVWLNFLGGSKTTVFQKSACH